MCVCARHRFISILLSIDSEMHARTNAKWQRNRVSEHLDTITNSMGDRVAMVMYLFLHAILSTTYVFPTFTTLSSCLSPFERLPFCFHFPHFLCCSFAIVVLLIPVVHTTHYTQRIPFLFIRLYGHVKSDV